MAWEKIEDPKWYHHPVPWILIFLAAAAFFGWPRAMRRYARWNAAQQVRLATEEIARGDFKQALLHAKAVLEVNPSDAGATRIMAHGLELAGASAAAMNWRARMNVIEPDNRENITAWAEDATKAGDFAAAERVLNMLKAEARASSGYHAAAAKLAMAKRDSAGAEEHWAEAVRLDPKEDAYLLPLSILRLKSKVPGQREDALRVLAEIGRRPPRSTEALRALLNDATISGESARAREIEAAIAAAPDATFDDKLRWLSSLREMEDPEAVRYLPKLRDASLANSEHLYRLFTWMNEHELGMLVSDWARTLPQEVILAQPASIGVADALARGLEWERLRGFLERRAWGEWEFLRRAFLAWVLEHVDEADEASAEWSYALTAARSRDDGNLRLERLAHLAVAWRWNRRAEEVMWSITSTPGCPRWMLDHLWDSSMERSDTLQLQRLSNLLLKSDPRSVEFRNRATFFTLLTRVEMGDPHGDAERLWEKNPGNVSAAITRGLSLHQQGRSREAMAVMDTLSAKDRLQPQAALYCAIFLTASGETARAAEFLPPAQGWRMFPEEKALLDRVKAAAALVAEEAARAALRRQ